MRTYPNSITLTSVMIEVRDRIKSGFDPVSALSTVSDGVLNWSKHEKEEE
jgi:hypothetical protein